MREVSCDPSPWPGIGDQIVFADGNTEGPGSFGAGLLAECNTGRETHDIGRKKPALANGSHVNGETEIAASISEEMADKVGFEPTVRFHVHTRSRRAP